MPESPYKLPPFGKSLQIWPERRHIGDYQFKFIIVIKILPKVISCRSCVYY